MPKNKLDLRCVLHTAPEGRGLGGLGGPGGPGAKIRPESRIKRTNPISRMIEFSGTHTASRQTLVA